MRGDFVLGRHPHTGSWSACTGAPALHTCWRSDPHERKKKGFKSRSMHLTEVAMIAVVSAVALCMPPDACTRALMVVAVLLVVALAHSESGGMEYDRGRHALASARRAAASSPTPVSNEATALPMTRNPRHRPADQTSSEAPSPKADADDKDGAQDARNHAVADPYAFAYSSAAMQARRDEFVFRGEPKRQSTESRMRMLDDMYRELLDTSVKSDPALRPVDSKGDGCQPLRGLQRKGTAANRLPL